MDDYYGSYGNYGGYGNYGSYESMPYINPSSGIDDGLSTLGAKIAGIGIGIVVWIIVIVAAVIKVISVWKIFKKCGREGWESLIPGHSEFVLFQLAGINPAWVILELFFTPSAIVFSFWKNINLAHHFGKSTAFGIGLALLPVIFYPILGFGNSSYSESDGQYAQNMNTNYNQYQGQNQYYEQNKYQYQGQNANHYQSSNQAQNINQYQNPSQAQGANQYQNPNQAQDANQFQSQNKWQNQDQDQYQNQNNSYQNTNSNQWAYEQQNMNNAYQPSNQNSNSVNYTQNLEKTNHNTASNANKNVDEYLNYNANNVQQSPGATDTKENNMYTSNDIDDDTNNLS